MSELRVLSVDATRSFLSQPGAQALEALPKPYWRKDHLPNALPLDPKAPETSAWALGVKPDTPVVVYCIGPECSNSRQSAEALIAAGLEHVRVFEGGKKAWLEAGLELETDERR